MCGSGPPRELKEELPCDVCGTQLMDNHCIYYPYYCPKCKETFSCHSSDYDDDENQGATNAG